MQQSTTFIVIPRMILSWLSPSYSIDDDVDALNVEERRAKTTTSLMTRTTSTTVNLAQSTNMRLYRGPTSAWEASLQWRLAWKIKIG